MTDHETYRNDLPLYLSGDLAPEEIKRLEAHLRDCAACRKEVVEAQGALDMLRRAGDDGGAAIDMTDFFDERIAPHLARRSLWSRTMLRAAALLLAFVTGMVVDRAAWPDPPPVVPEVADSPEENWRQAQERRSGLARALVYLSRKN